MVLQASRLSIGNHFNTFHFMTGLEWCDLKMQKYFGVYFDPILVNWELNHNWLCKFAKKLLIHNVLENW